MKVTLAKNLSEATNKSWQAAFPEETPCCHCGNSARLAFVAHEKIDDEDPDMFVCDLHSNEPADAGFWPHDCVAVAVYFCRGCLDTTALYNQA